MWENDGVEITSNDRRTRSTPSYVTFTDIERLIGDDAKRLIDRKLTDPFEQSDMDLWSFKGLSDASYKQIIQIQFMGEQKKFHPEEVSSMVLTKTKETTEAYLRNQMNVVTVSANFSDSQRQATKDTWSISELERVTCCQWTEYGSNYIRIGQRRRWQPQLVDPRRCWRHF